MRRKALRQMSKIIFGALIVFALALTAYAQDEQSGALEYSFNDDGTCSVIGIGSYVGSDITVPSEYNGYSVTRIEDKAFYDNTEITSVTAPSVKSIGDFAFHYCISLESISFDNVEIVEDSAFYFCTELTEVNLGEKLETVERYAFYNCTDIDVLVLPNTTRELQEAAFKYCSNIIKLTLGEVLGISKDENNDADLVASNAFAECNKIVEVYNYSKYNLYFGSTEAGGAGTYSLTVHTDKDEPSILTWRDDGFVFATVDGANYLVSHIGKETELVLPNSFNGSKYAIYHFAFVNRTSLEKIDLGTGITTIGVCAFDFCANVKTLVIPEGVWKIGGLAFNDCHLLESITLPSTLESIGAGAFQKCYNLKAIKIPDSVTEISYGMFISCLSLESINIPSTITKIDDCAF
ncbi:MAG: leucine-rich repeat domain-containing protein, partial [Clostridia bacterium]|nr:leucine-rich repeat domain-containing protein [Clostridia bacterium]